jgi:hypothetical protein
LQNWIKNSWLSQLYSKSKLLAVIAGLFFLLTLLANLIKLETTPFFIWSMYDNPMPDKQDYEVFLIRYNDSTTINFSKTWKEPQKIVLTGSLFYYLQYKENNDTELYRKYLEDYWAVKHPAFKWVVPYLANSSEKFAAFPSWYKRYLSHILDQEINQVDVIKKMVRFAEDGTLSEISSDTVRLIH